MYIIIIIYYYSIIYIHMYDYNDIISREAVAFTKSATAAVLVDNQVKIWIFFIWIINNSNMFQTFKFQLTVFMLILLYNVHNLIKNCNYTIIAQNAISKMSRLTMKRFWSIQWCCNCNLVFHIVNLILWKTPRVVWW